MCKQAADTDIHKHLFMSTRALVISCSAVYAMPAVDYSPTLSLYLELLEKMSRLPFQISFV